MNRSMCEAPACFGPVQASVARGLSRGPSRQCIQEQELVKPINPELRQVGLVRDQVKDSVETSWIAGVGRGPARGPGLGARPVWNRHGIAAMAERS